MKCINCENDGRYNPLVDAYTCGAVCQQAMADAIRLVRLARDQHKQRTGDEPV